MWKIIRGLYFGETGRILPESQPRGIFMLGPRETKDAAEKHPWWPLIRDTPSLVSHPSATGPRGHETRYSVRRRWRRGRLVIGAESPFSSWTRSPASTPYCDPGIAGERAP